MNAELVSYEVNSKTFEGLHVKPETKNVLFLSLTLGQEEMDLLKG